MEGSAGDLIAILSTLVGTLITFGGGVIIYLVQKVAKMEAKIERLENALTEVALTTKSNQIKQKILKALQE